MFKILVTPEERNKRAALCNSCEFYKPDTRTCGTFRLINPLGDLVIHEGRDVRLCGCIMPVKWNFSSTSCPLGRWDKLIDDETLEEIKRVVQEYSGKPSILKDDMKKIVDTYNVANSSKQAYTECGSCIKELLDEMAKLVEVTKN